MLDAATAATTIRDDAQRLADAARAAGKGATVPTCPGWEVGRLVVHTGRVHRWAAVTVATGSPAERQPGPDDDADPCEWLIAGVESLVEVLSSCDPAAAVWNWSGANLSAGWWWRRMAVETAVHRVDAELAAGWAPSDVERAVAVAGIDEVFDSIAVRTPRSGWNGESLHLHATDGPGEWSVVVHNDRLDVTTEHAKGDAAVRGGAGALLLWLYRRGTPAVEAFGDEALLLRWREQFQP